MTSPDSPKIEHQPFEQRFVIQCGDQLAKLEYERQGDEVNFHHTYVPFRLRGLGLAEAIVQHGLSWAKAEGLNVSASCWYVAKQLETWTEDF